MPDDPEKDKVTWRNGRYAYVQHNAYSTVANHKLLKSIYDFFLREVHPLTSLRF